MESLVLNCPDLTHLPELARQIMSFSRETSVWLFGGEMGAGKTTFIRALADEYKVEDEVSSPSFSIVNEYLGGDGELIYHFDFYRIKSESEAIDIGLDEYLYSGNLCLIEWPDKIKPLWPDEYLMIDIELDDTHPEARKITVMKND